ncbi:hypothetical protein MMC14_007528, partial [Varicellaria rhodocarpa]|nr:hypothetical protein [Varicellaria rhodocarpa]
HALRLKEGQKLWDADLDESGRVRVLELGVNFLNRFAERFHLLYKIVKVLATGGTTSSAEDGV